MKKHGFFICSSDFARSKIQLLRSGLPLCSCLALSSLNFYLSFLVLSVVAQRRRIILFSYPRLILSILYPANFLPFLAFLNFHLFFLILSYPVIRAKFLTYLSFLSCLAYLAISATKW